MLTEQMKKALQSYNNFDLILSFPSTNFIEFVCCCEVSCAELGSNEKNFVSSYEKVKSILQNRIESFIEEKYEESSPEYLEQQFDLSNIPIKTEVSDNYRLIYFYAKVASLKEKNTTPTAAEIDATTSLTFLNKIIFQIKEENKKTITERKYTPLSPFENVLKNFKEWIFYPVAVDTEENLLDSALQNILLLSNRKGSWITAPQKIKSLVDSSLAPTLIENIKDATQVSTNDDKNKTLVDLEKEILSAFLYSFKNITAEKPIFLTSNSWWNTKIALIGQSFKDDITGGEVVLIGFPKSLINRFPKLSLSVDLQTPKIELKAEYEGLNDLNKTIEKLESVINKKQDSLQKNSLSIANYSTSNILKRLKNFVATLSQTITEQYGQSKININEAKLIFNFKTIPCKDKDNLCLEEFVDKQTNLALDSAKIDSTSQIILNSKDSEAIDKKLAAYLLANAKQIINSEQSYVAKNFFSKLIYEKTKFSVSQGLSLDTFYGATQASIQNIFVSDTVKLLQYSKIRKNIENKSYANQTVSASIKDILGDIRSLKELFESILYKFDVNDTLVELEKCISTRLENDLKKNIVYEFINSIFKFLEPNKYVYRFFQCSGIAEQAGISSVVDSLPIIINKIVSDPSAKSQKDFTDAVSAVGEKYANYFSDNISDPVFQDKIITTFIKCVDEYATYTLNEEMSALAKTYLANEDAKKILKEQYDLLVLEAKRWKTNPGTSKKDSSLDTEMQFLKTATRNSWKLLQKQAEIQLEKLALEAGKALLKQMLDYVNLCKNPDENKDSESNNPPGIPGEINIALPIINVNSRTEMEISIDSLFARLSSFFPPEKICALFYGNASEEIYESVLSIIKSEYNSLYSATKPIIYNKLVVSANPLSTVFTVKEFFTLFSIEFPTETKNKCDQYFTNLSNNPIKPKDDESCIDVSEEYKLKRRKELKGKGYSDAQAEEIIKNETNKQKQILKQVQDLKDKGLYNELSDQSEPSILPMSQEVKQKVLSKLPILVQSYTDTLKIYRMELTKLIFSQAPFKDYEKGGSIPTTITLENNKYNFSFGKKQPKVEGDAIEFGSITDTSIGYKEGEKNKLFKFIKEDLGSIDITYYEPLKFYKITRKGKTLMESENYISVSTKPNFSLPDKFYSFLKAHERIYSLTNSIVADGRFDADFETYQKASKAGSNQSIVYDYEKATKERGTNLIKALISNYSSQFTKNSLSAFFLLKQENFEEQIKKDILETLKEMINFKE